MVQRHGFTLRFCIFISADGDIGDLFFQRLQAGDGLGGVFYQMVWASCFQNEAFLDAAWVTLKVGCMSLNLAHCLGTMAAYVLVRGGRFRGRTLFSGMIYAPLVMPEVITGLSLLLLFIGIGLDRGVSDNHLGAYHVFNVLRLGRRLLAPCQFDRSLEEAALDLGCSPFEAFRLVTCQLSHLR